MTRAYGGPYTTPTPSSTTAPASSGPIKLEHVEYLALEGGGGKGVAYLGAIKALEALGVLPIRIMANKPKFGKNAISTTFEAEGRSQIKAIAGSSAGAITALCLAIGMSSTDLLELLRKKEGGRSVFDTFFEGDVYPFDKVVRTTRVGDTAHPQTVQFDEQPFKGPIPTPQEVADAMTFSALGMRIGINLAVSKAMLPMIQTAAQAGSTLSDALIGWPCRDKRPLPLRKDLRSLWTHLACFQDMGGLFPGREVRRFFSEILYKYLFQNASIATELDKRVAAYNERWPNRWIKLDEPEQITFAQLYYLTGVDILITGTNVTHKKPMEFSKDRTPDFPVTEAVMISMNLPGVFVPIFVGTDVFRDESEYELGGVTFSTYNNMYRGFYVDGGVLNNLPLRTLEMPDQPFRKYIDPDKPRTPDNPRANLKTFALRLTDGFYGGRLPAAVASQPPAEPTGKDNLVAILDLTAFRQGEKGQILNATYLARTIDCYTHALSTEQFYATPRARELPILYSYVAVAAYFGCMTEADFKRIRTLIEKRYPPTVVDPPPVKEKGPSVVLAQIASAVDLLPANRSRFARDTIAPAFAGTSVKTGEVKKQFLALNTMLDLWRD